MQGNYHLADVQDLDAVKSMSRAITSWDPLLSLKVGHGESLYDGVRTCYGLNVGAETTLAFRDRKELAKTGDAIVMPPAVRVAAFPAADFVWVCHEGLAPEHLRGAAGLAMGFEHFSLALGHEDRSICGHRREVLPVTDLRHRVHYHFVEISNPEPHLHADMVELYYVLGGEGNVRIGPSLDQLTEVPVRADHLLAVGPGLYHVASDGLRMCIWFLYNEAAHRRRVREAKTSSA